MTWQPIETAKKDETYPGDLDMAEVGDSNVERAGKKIQDLLNPSDETPKYAFALIAIRIGEYVKPSLVSNLTDSDILCDLLSMGIESADEYVEACLNHPKKLS